MKKTLLFVLFCGSVVAAAAILKPEKKPVVEKITVSYENKNELKNIPVKVTLTKYQLQKMLDILEEDNKFHNEYDGITVPADSQDTYTFTSVAKGNKGEYSISSTHLSRK
tara:strand:- start:206 stop:535 length:330 start_codon:yes stop_codon:yes gene_type:complete